MKKLDYDPINHGTFEEEWGVHKKNKEWWYATGILFDDAKNTCRGAESFVERRY